MYKKEASSQPSEAEKYDMVVRENAKSLANLARCPFLCGKYASAMIQDADIATEISSTSGGGGGCPQCARGRSLCPQVMLSCPCIFCERRFLGVVTVLRWHVRSSSGI